MRVLSLFYWIAGGVYEGGGEEEPIVIGAGVAGVKDERAGVGNGGAAGEREVGPKNGRMR